MLKGQFLSYNQNGRQIFQDLNFELTSGQILYVLGSNGSGKSTLLRTLAGFIPLTAGKLLINDEESTNNFDFIAQNVEYIGHLNSVKSQMTVWENLSFWFMLARKKRGEFDDVFNIRKFKDRIINRCSEGQIRRLSLSRLSISDKKIWLLDEPTASLDNNSQELFLKLIKKHCLSGGIAVISTHIDLKISNTKALSLYLENQKPKSNSLVSDPFLGGDW